MRLRFLLLLGLLGCETSRQPLPLNVTTVYDVEGKSEFVKVVVHTLPSASVSATFSLDAASGKTERANAAGDATLRLIINPSWPSVVEVQVRGHQPPGKQIYIPAVLTRKVTRTPMLVLDVDGRLRCTLKTCIASVTDAGVVEIFELDQGVTATINGAATPVTGHGPVSKGRASLPLDVQTLAATVPIAEIFSGGERRTGAASPAKIQIQLQWPDGAQLRGALPLQWKTLRSAVVQHFSAAGPLTLRQEGSAKGTLTLDGFGSISPDVTRLGDIGYVISPEEQAPREQHCGSYRNSAGVTIKIGPKLYDLKVTVHERRTGKVLGQRTFPAPKVACPKVITTGVADSRAQFGSAEAAWARSIAHP